MNQLNSILIEGDLVADPTIDGAACGFTITNRRTVKEVTCEMDVYIVTINRLAGLCAEYLKKGRGVKIIGILKGTENGLPMVLAEHVEFKPAKRS